MIERTKEQKQEYFANLRSQRAEAKIIAENIDEATKADIEKVQSVIPTMSYVGYMFCKMQMNKLGYKGLPGLDCKTFKGWKEQGFVVKKSEKSNIYGITRIKTTDSEGEDSGMYPKVYHLFHSSQIETLSDKQ